MRIIQMLPTIAYGDGVGNDTLALADTLKEAGYETQIYADLIDGRLGEGVAKQADTYEYQEGDIILYHLSTGSDLNYKITEYPCRRIIIYHNVTPPHYFMGYSPESEKMCAAGLRAVKYLRNKADLCLVDSAYNGQDLIAMGYECAMEVLPILIAFDDYKKEPDKKIIRDYGDDGWVNIVFTGRVVPNKCPQDVIAAFACYQKYIQPKSRLFLVGRYDWSQFYKYQLEEYARRLGAKEVYFTGHVRFDEILAYYHIADAFVCMSEHEGFCIPLVEAMFFDVPVIAYDSSAISDTLGGSGLLLKDKSPQVVAEAIHMVVENKELREQILEGQRERLKDFEHGKIKDKFLKIIEEFIAGEEK